MAPEEVARQEFNKHIEQMGELWAAKLTLQMGEMLEPMKKLVEAHEQDLNDPVTGIKKTVNGLSKWRWVATGVLLALSSAVFWQVVTALSKHTN
jgi:hypothetical protein